MSFNLGVCRLRLHLLQLIPKQIVVLVVRRV